MFSYDLVNGLVPFNYNSKCSHVQAMASASGSVWLYQVSVTLSALFANALTLFRISIAPNLTGLASTITSISLCASK